MFTNLLKVTLRTLYREKIYAIVNVGGLSIAIACCTILGLWLESDLTYDLHNTKYKQIYRIENEIYFDDKFILGAHTPDLLGPLLARDYPEVKGFVHIYNTGRKLIDYKDKSYYWENVCATENHIFNFFTHNIIFGNPETALLEPQTAAVSSTFAKQYFGEVNPIGENIELESGTYTISLVFDDLPENSHYKYDVLIAVPPGKIPDDGEAITGYLGNYSTCTFLLMPEDYNIEDFRKISDDFDERYLQGRPNIGKRWLRPLADLHYNRESLLGDEPTGNIYYLYGFIGVGVFILLVACMNYINLATALASKRIKEVGIRKILGSGKTSLILQFMGEAIFFSLFAMFIGLMLVELASNLTPLDQLLSKFLSLDLNHRAELIGWVVAFSLAIGLVSGIYPAIHLSSLGSASNLADVHNRKKQGALLRKMLVLSQLTISVCVIACTLLMAIQMRYVSNKFLGFEKENRLIVTLQGTEDLIKKVPVIKKELLKNSNILGASLSSSEIGKLAEGVASWVENNENIPRMETFSFINVDNDFVEVMGLNLIAGRNISWRSLTKTDGTDYIVNETMVKKMGWDQPLGKGIKPLWGGLHGKVVGVVNDFHSRSLHENIEAFAFRPYPGIGGLSDQYRPGMKMCLVVNIKGVAITDTLHFIRETVEEFDQEHHFEFLEDTLNKMYLSEQRLMKLIGIFSTVCVFISSLGLFGLAAFTTEQRTKEIGIRKVLGASTWQIVTMLSNRIFLLVLLGAVVASLISYYAMDEWLSDFAYRISINKRLWVFLLAAALSAGIAFITVSLQSYKTARADPVEALRYELGTAQGSWRRARGNGFGRV